MQNRRPQLENGLYYHIYNRGVDRRDVFADDRDRYRFIHDLYEFNDEHDVVNLVRLTHEEQLLHRLPDRPHKPRKLLVDIVAFALMPNHYHLLLRQRVDDGISLFMKKIGGGYTLYFNEKHDRSGSLFQGRYKAKLIDRDSYLRHVVNYIHANPIPLLPSKSKLRTYRWSSFPDYIDERNFPSLISWDVVKQLALPQGAAHEKQVLDLASIKFDSHIEELTFEE